MDQLTLREKVGVNYMLLELSGTMNANTCVELEQKVYQYIIDSNVVLDMEQVLEIDSSGVGVIIAGHNDGEKYGTRLFIMNPSEPARIALTKTGFIDVFNIIHSVTEVADV
ncbi:MAG: STAS domain-containing protein [Treponema sp.]|nr:STAS domain-containing protein [Spirochaetia bacterium]MDD7460609.1 STAS domain-containing protein [Spirochaetales bacterium]MDY5811156.1 STAS domain-containing protein [Treponema sp.]MEE1181395.1 STAS domain-containing protein [Treponema sp.]